MNKKCIAVAATAILTTGVAQADGTTLYGSVRLAIEYTDLDNSYAEVTNSLSRFGIKGSEDLGNGLSAFYRYEFGVDSGRGSIRTEDTQRLSFVGLKSETLGSFSLGSQWSPYYNVVGDNDFYNSNFSYERTYLGRFRIANIGIYSSPLWAGFKFELGLIADGEGGNSDDVDSYNLAAWYVNGGFKTGLTYLGTNGLDDDGGLLGGIIRYNNDQYYISLVGEIGNDYPTSNQFVTSGEDPYNINLSGAYYFGDTDLIRATVSYVDYDTDSDLPQDAFNYAFGYQHNFSKRTRIWAEYSYFDVDDVDDALQQLSLGIRTDF